MLSLLSRRIYNFEDEVLDGPNIYSLIIMISNVPVIYLHYNMMLPLILTLTTDSNFWNCLSRTL